MLNVFPVMRIYLGIIGWLLLALVAVGLFGGRADATIDRIANQAIERRDPALCDRLEVRHEELPGPPEQDGKGAPRITYPRNVCLSLYLHASKDRGVCERLTPQDDDPAGGAIEACYEFIADVHQDPTACEKIPESAHRWKSLPICIAVAKRDVRECDVLDEMDKRLSYSSKTDCILEVVKRTRDASSCAGITRPGYGSFDPEAAAGYKNECLLQTL